MLGVVDGWEVYTEHAGITTLTAQHMYVHAYQEELHAHTTTANTDEHTYVCG